MIGKNTITIDASDFIKGLSSGPDINDGGFSTETDAVNITANPGVLYAPANVTDKSTNLTDNIIAACENPTYLSGFDQMYLDDTGAFYTWNGTTLTKKVTASSDKFTEGTTDFQPWYDTSGGVNYYATTKAGASGDIVKWNGDATLTETWWSGAGTLNQGALSALTPWRPLQVYETYLFIGDKNKLHRVAPDLTVSNGILQLGVMETISAIGVDKASGLLMIAATQSADYSASKNTKSKIYLYDGLSPKAARVIPINGLITSFKSTDDRTIVFIGNKIGYFTGSGVKFLRKMNFALGDATKLVYPHRACVIENTVYYAENAKVIAYGEVREKGDKIFYPVVSNNVNSNTYKCISSIGAGLIGLAFASSKFYTFDTTSVASTGGITFYTNKYVFPRPVNLRVAYVEYADAVTTLDDNRSLYYRTDREDITLLRVQGTDTGSGLKNSSASSVNFIENIIGFKDQARWVQFRYNASTTNFGVRRIVITYDVAE